MKNSSSNGQREEARESGLEAGEKQVRAGKSQGVKEPFRNEVSGQMLSRNRWEVTFIVGGGGAGVQGAFRIVFLFPLIIMFVISAAFIIHIQYSSTILIRRALRMAVNFIQVF